MSMVVRGRIVGVLMCLLVSSLAGCGSGSGGVRYVVTGKVTYNDQPLETGRITAIANDQEVSAADIKPDGTFVLTDIPKGPIKVIINPKNVLQMMPSDKATGGGVNATKQPGVMGNTAPGKNASNTIPAKYQSAGLTDLNFTIEKNNQAIEVVLKGT